MLSHKRGLRTELRIRRYDQKMGSSCQNNSRGSKGQRPLAGSWGAAPPKEIYNLGSRKWENQVQNQVQETKRKRNRETDKNPSVRADGQPPERFCLRAEFCCTPSDHFPRAPLQELKKSARADLKISGRVQCSYTRRFLASSKPIWCLFKEKNVAALGVDFSSSFYAIICW